MMKKLQSLGLLIVLLMTISRAGAQQTGNNNVPWPSPLLTSSVSGQEKSTGKSDIKITLKENESSRSAILLYDNGPVINSPGTGAGGADESYAIQPVTALAYPSATPVRVADDFIITDNEWDIDSIVFFDITPNTPISPSFYSAYYIRIWNGRPGENGSHIIWGDRTTNRLVSSQWANAYRVGEQGVTNLPIFRNACGTNGLTLPAGHYWVEVQAKSNFDDYTYMPPVVAEIPASGDALYLNERTFEWINWHSNEFPQGMPFMIYGNPILENLDAAVVKIVSPQSAAGLTSAEPITIKVKNAGYTILPSLQVSYMLNNGPVITETVAGPIAPGQEITYTFTQTADLSATQQYELIVTSMLAGDQFSGNNQLIAKIRNYSNVTLMSDGATAACSGVFYDSGGPDGNYSNNEDYEMHFYPATGATNAKMEFNFLEYSTECFWDSLYIYDGPTWEHHPLLKVIHGGHINEIGVIRSTDPSGALTFRFKSDYEMALTGWKAEYHCHIPFDNDLAAIDLYAPLNAIVDRPAEFRVKVKNEGNLTMTDYQVKLFCDNDLEIGSVTGLPLAYNEEREFVILGTFPAAGLHKVYGKTVLTGDQDIKNDCTTSFETEVKTEGSGYIIVGNQTSNNFRLPVSYGSYNSLCESIYFPEEIGMEGMITGAGYIYSFREDVEDAPLKIWMGETELNDLTSGWIPSGELTLVYDGTVDYQVGVDTVKINFSTPFEYHGGNLVMLVYRPLDYTVYAGHYKLGPNLFQVSETPQYPNRTRNFFADIMVLNPESPRFGTTDDKIANTLFMFDVSMMSQLSGIVTAEGEGPVENATVLAEGTHTKSVTNHDGDYSINYIWPGQHQATASKYYYDDDTESINFTAGSSQSHNFTLQTRQKGYVSGSVRPSDAPWNGLEDAIVTMTGYDTVYTATTNNAGSFLIPQVYGNVTYQLNITHPGYENYDNPVIIGSTGSRDLGSLILREQTAYPENITAVDNSSSADVTWDAATLEYTIQYDNDSVYYYMTSFSAGRHSAIRFTPQAYPCEVRKAQFNVYDAGMAAGNPPSSFDVEVYDDDGENGKPGTLLGQVTATPGGDGWCEVDLTSLNIMVTSGDFYIAHLQTGTWPSYVELGLDKSEHPENRSWTNTGYWPGWVIEQWSWHYMIRAVVAGSNADDMTLNPSTEPSIGESRNGERSGLTGYSVYRLLDGQQNDTSLWTPLSSNQSGASYQDNTWPVLPNGEYVYAVRTNYANNVLSASGFSNILNKNMYTTANITLVTNAGYSPSDAHLVFTKTDEGDVIYTADTAVNGEYQIYPFKRGTYRVQVTHHNFMPFDQVIDMNYPNDVEIFLTEKVLAPEWANAEDHDTVAFVEWYDPELIRQKVLDDGVSETGLGSAMGHFWFGNLFHNRYPGAKVISVDLFFEQHPFADQEEASVDFFDAQHNLLGTSEPFIPEYNTWNTVKVNDIELPDEFFAMIHFNQVYSPSHYIGLDRNGSPNSSEMGWMFDGFDWNQISAIGAGVSGFFMIRPSVLITPESLMSLNRSTSDFSLYLLQPGEENEPGLWHEVNLVIPETEYNDEGWYTLINGDYRYAVRSNYLSGMTSDYSFTNVLTKPVTYPAPKNLAISETGEGEALFTWNPFNREDRTGYDIYLDDLTTPYATVTDTSYTFTGLTPNVPYLAGVRNHYQSGVSEISTIQFTLIITNTNSELMKKPEIFPNPAREVVFVAEAKGAFAELYTATGELVLARQLDEAVTRLRLEGLANGVYIMKIRNNTSITSQKLIISR